ncbi:MAG: right-handed parallel beta-helix repeat-containing protein [Lewinellaceae bacterium]|nr:right-handed parallel beta-helix repeat-containing protein [Lewinellaceae bacterium]
MTNFKYKFVFLWILLLYQCTNKIAPSAQNQSSTNTSELISSHDSIIQAEENSNTLIFLSSVAENLHSLSYSLVSPKLKTTTQMVQPGIAMMLISNGGSGQSSLEIEVFKNKKPINKIQLKLLTKKPKGKISYCNPSVKNMTGDGTLDHPYPSLAQLFDSGYMPEENETIYLLNGNHGDVTVKSSQFNIVSYKENYPRLRSISFQSAHHVKVSGITIISKLPQNANLVFADSLSSYIEISNCHIADDVEENELASKDWKNYVASGIYMKGNHNRIINNLIQLVFHGIQFDGDENLFSCNIIDRFCGDAIRNTGNKNVYSNNFLSNALIDDYYEPYGNHDDLFQAWTHDKPIEHITIKDNIAISILDSEIQNKSKIVQGIVCFDGFSDHWIIEDNVVYTDHPHGIALFGATNCTIRNNKVFRNPKRMFKFESDPWIMVRSHKDNRESVGNVVEDNISNVYRLETAHSKISNNIILDSISQNKWYEKHGWKE